MNHRILVSVFMLIAFSSFSKVALARDIKKGTVQVSGDSTTTFGSSNRTVNGNKESKSSGIDINISALYYLVDNFAVGALAGYSNTDYTYYNNGMDSGNLSTKQKSKHIGPIFQVSVPMTNSANLFIGATTGYVSEEIEYYYRASGFFYGAQAGVSLFPVDRFSLDIGISYLHESGKDDLSKYDLERDDIHGSIGLSVYF